jgi:hypothetical protein
MKFGLPTLGLAAGAALMLLVFWVSDHLRDDRDIPEDWLSETDQDELADHLYTTLGSHGWAAGCLWPAGTEHDVLEVADRLDLNRDLPWQSLVYRTAAGNLIVVLAREGGLDTATTSFDEQQGDDFLCYRPAESDGPVA